MKGGGKQTFRIAIFSITCIWENGRSQKVSKNARVSLSRRCSTERRHLLWLSLCLASSSFTLSLPLSLFPKFLVLKLEWDALSPKMRVWAMDALDLGISNNDRGGNSENIPESHNFPLQQQQRTYISIPNSYPQFSPTVTGFYGRDLPTVLSDAVRLSVCLSA